MRAPEFWTGKDARARLAAAALAPAAALYGLGVKLSRRGAVPYRPKACVLCVGNLTVGGTGKTPLAIALARRLMARGRRVMFLTRGHGGTLRGPVRVDPVRHSAAEVGDESLLLAQTAPVVVARDRAAGARMADAAQADVIVMDDGFQNFSVAKDVALLAVDAETGFGNGRLLPAGPLREPVAAGLARADAVILVGDGDPVLPHSGKPILRAMLHLSASETWKGRTVFAFAGIGRPEKFFAALRDSGARLAGSQGFADHHVYTDAELASLRDAAQRHGAELVTTEKDFVRIAPAQRAGVVPVPAQAMFADEAALAPLLDRLTAAGD